MNERGFGDCQIRINYELNQHFADENVSLCALWTYGESNPGLVHAMDASYR